MLTESSFIAQYQQAWNEAEECDMSLSLSLALSKSQLQHGVRFTAECYLPGPISISTFRSAPCGDDCTITLLIIAVNDTETIELELRCTLQLYGYQHSTTVGGFLSTNTESEGLG